MGDKVDFLAADKCDGFLQGGSIVLGVGSQACSKYIKLQISNVFAISQGKRKKIKLIFCLQINIKDFFKLML